MVFPLKISIIYINQGEKNEKRFILIKKKINISKRKAKNME